jgi:2-oxoisovalerate ferredoxin oxidoreductase beta subunit
MQAATNLFPKESFLATLRQALQDRCALLELNEEAFAWGEKAYREAIS